MFMNYSIKDKIKILDMILKSNKLILLVVLLVNIILYICYYNKIYLNKNTIKNNMERSKIKVYKSICLCKQNEKIVVIELNKNVFEVYLIKDQSRRLLYNILKNEYNELLFTCNMYSSLKRGKKQKVISYSLFDRNGFYYDKIKNISKQIRKFYPDWFMRIYHDSSINKSIICDIECLRDENGEMIDNTDFCDLSNFKVILKGQFVNPVKYVFPRMWRFFAIGDSFIDTMMSRDTDSYILQREVESVNVWLKSDKLLHIMRDHPIHNSPILAGMWGFKIGNNRTMSQKIFNLSIDSRIIKKLDRKKQKPKGIHNYFIKFKKCINYI